MSAIPRAHPLRGPLPSALRRPTRAPRSRDEAKARCWIPAFAGMTACGVRNDEGFFVASAAMRRFCGQESASLLLGVPLGRGEGAEEKPEGSARGIAPSSLPAQGRAVSEPRSALTSVAGQEPGDRGRGGCPSLGLLSLGQARESDPAARRADGKTHGCVLGENRIDQSKIKMDPGFRRDDGDGWIPASAGTTA